MVQQILLYCLCVAMAPINLVTLYVNKSLKSKLNQTTAQLTALTKSTHALLRRQCIRTGLCVSAITCCACLLWHTYNKRRHNKIFSTDTKQLRERNVNLLLKICLARTKIKKLHQQLHATEGDSEQKSKHLGDTIEEKDALQKQCAQNRAKVAQLEQLLQDKIPQTEALQKRVRELGNDLAQRQRELRMIRGRISQNQQECAAKEELWYRERARLLEQIKIFEARRHPSPTHP